MFPASAFHVPGASGTGRRGTWLQVIRCGQAMPATEKTLLSRRE